MHDSVSVTVRGSLENLIRELLDLFWRQRSAKLAHILLQVVFAVLEDQEEAVLLINHFLQSTCINDNQKLKMIQFYYLLDYVRVLDALQQADLTNSRTRHSIILLLELNLLQRHNLHGKRSKLSAIWLTNGSDGRIIAVNCKR